MARAGLIVSDHADDIEILAGINLIVCLCLRRLMDDALANVGKQLPRHCVGNRAVSRRLLEADGVIQTGQIARASAHLELLEVE